MEASSKAVGGLMYNNKGDALGYSSRPLRGENVLVQAIFSMNMLHHTIMEQSMSLS